MATLAIVHIEHLASGDIGRMCRFAHDEMLCEAKDESGGEAELTQHDTLPVCVDGDCVEPVPECASKAQGGCFSTPSCSAKKMSGNLLFCRWCRIPGRRTSAWPRCFFQ